MSLGRQKNRNFLRDAAVAKLLFSYGFVELIFAKRTKLLKNMHKIIDKRDACLIGLCHKPKTPRRRAGVLAFILNN